MIARRHARVVLAIVMCSLAAHAHAQERARRAVAAGDVTGLEMSIEGVLHAPPGGHVRWLVTTYEVLHRRDLRVASGIELAVTASFGDGAVLTTAISDASGHAVLDITLPDDLDFDPSVSVEAVSARGVRRTFDAPITRDSPTTIELLVDRERAPPGGTVALIGRVRSTIDGQARVGIDVEVALRAGTLVRAPIAVTTDDAGVFVTELALPDAVGAYEIEATIDEVRASIGVAVRVDAVPVLWARAVPGRAVVRPGETVDVDVLVRDAQGAAVAGARVEWTDAPPPADDAEVVRTNADGRATLPWSIDRSAGPAFEDRSRALRVVHAAHGTGTAIATVRVTRSDVFVAWSVEGGALAPGLPTQLFVRSTRVDGSAMAGASITLAAGALGALRTATTDRDGVASFVVAAASEAHDDASGCSGPTAVLASLEIEGTTQEACLPIEPDALIAVHAERLRDQIAVSLVRRAQVEARSMAIVVLAQQGGAWQPVSRQVLGPHQATALLDAPRFASTLWVRARAIVDGEEVASGGTVVFAGDMVPIDTLLASADGASLSVSPLTRSRAIVAVDAAFAPGLTDRIAQLASPLGAAVASDRTPLFVAALAASMVPRDTAAPAVLREGALAPVSMPDDAPAQGLLRDPWRTRSRFVRGRLGALMRSVEQLVDARVPDGIDQVGVRENGAWRFDREMLEAAMTEAGLGDERAAALDGEPLDIAALTALDPSFTYDHVARRITRARLFRVLWFLRQLVRERELDLAWARPGDPREYPVSLLDAGISWQDEYPQREHLFDGWGHPFVLVPVHGHAHFDRFQPVPGFELVSGGPDGHVGNADDVFDPFARVLASGSVYAEAVQEDELVARLGSVELGRATVATLAETFSCTPVIDYADHAPATRASWGSEPMPPHEASLDALAPVPAVARALVASGGSPASTLSATWSPASERHAYVAFGLAFDASGGVAVRTQSFDAGAPFMVRIDMPEVLRVGDSLRLPVRIVPLTHDAPSSPALAIEASSPALHARVEGHEVVLDAMEVSAASLTLTAVATLEPVVHVASAVRVLPPGSLRSAHAGAITSGETAVDLRMPDHATPWRARWVIGALASLRRDPLFAEDAHDAALSAWADVLGGTAPSADDLAALEYIVAVAPSGLHTACALVVWASVLDDASRDPQFMRALGTLGANVPAALSARAAMLAALAPAAPAMGDTSSPIASTVITLRDDAWSALATERDHPTTLAELAAALLLVDRNDAVARALFDRARAEADPREGFVRGTSDDLAGTLALVIAARQLDEDALADTLATSVIARLHLVTRLDVETRFWALAASSFGALGGDAPHTATVVIDGAVRDVSLDGGAVVLDDIRPGADVRVRSEGRLFVRGELRALVPYARVDELAVDARIEGDLGVRGERAGLQLVVESTGDEAIDEAVVEIALPSLAALDAAARAAITSAGSVIEVAGPDRAGVLRLSLGALRAHATLRVPLPLRWLASGHAHAFGIVVYDRRRPWAMTTREERVIEVSAR